jgi:plasmid stability protein
VSAPFLHAVRDNGRMAALRARLTVRITPDDVGARVSVRALHHGPEAGMTDVVGVLRAWDDGALTIERRDGSTATVAVADLVAGRVVPAPPARKGDATLRAERDRP